MSLGSTILPSAP